MVIIYLLVFLALENSWQMKQFFFCFIPNNLRACISIRVLWSYPLGHVHFIINETVLE